MISEEELRSKRIYVGVLAVLFLAAGLGLMVFQPDKDGMQGALMRVALLLGAFLAGDADEVPTCRVVESVAVDRWNRDR